MVLIVNYDLYLRINGSWQLHGRYASDQKKKAFLDAKNAEENQFYPVKIIKENFNSETSDATENIVYMSKNTFDSKKNEIEQAKKEKEKRKKQIQKNKETKKSSKKTKVKKENKTKNHNSDKILSISAKILILTTISIVLAKGLLWIINPILEIIYKGDSLSNAKFFAFLILFLSFAIPLIVKNISWNVLYKPESEENTKPKINKKEVKPKEDNVRDGFATPFEPVAIDYTKQSLSVLNKFIAVLKELKAPINKFTKFGIKLALYGACNHLKEKENLSQGQINTLLYEAFGIIEKENINSVAEFYESKASYENIDIAKTLIRAGEAVMSNINEYDNTEFDKLTRIMSSWYSLSEQPNKIENKDDNSHEVEQNLEIKSSPLYEESEDVATSNENKELEADDKAIEQKITKDKDNNKTENKETSQKENDVVTVLFSDIVNSTSLNDEHGDKIAFEILEAHNKIYRENLNEFDGKEIKHTGDGIMGSFSSVAKAAEAAIAMQKQFFEFNHKNHKLPKLEVKIGMNTGEPVKSNNDLFGATVQIASRCCSQASAGEIVVTTVVKELLIGKGIKFSSLGEKKLKGINDPITLYKIMYTQDPIFEDEESSNNNQNNTDEDFIKAGVF